MRDLRIALLCSFGMSFVLLAMVAALGVRAASQDKEIRELAKAVTAITDCQHELVETLRLVVDLTTGESE